jgi:hypothetical protein
MVNMCSGSHDIEFLSKLGSAREHMSGRINDYVNAWNGGDLDAVMNTFVDDGLDYTDHGKLMSPAWSGRYTGSF